MTAMAGPVGVARTGQIDPNTQDDIPKAFWSPPLMQQNAIRQLHQVTSTWCSFHLRRVVGLCHRSDDADGRSRAPTWQASTDRFC